MAARNPLIEAPPYAVEQALKKLGADLRTARLRRNLSVEDVAQKIGAGVRTVRDAEKGKPSTSVAVYAGLLWAFDLHNNLGDAADPLKDKEGQALALARERTRARRKRGMSNEF